MSKNLKTSVSLETRTAEARLKALTKAINKVQFAVDKSAKQSNNLERNLQKSVKTANNIASATRKISTAQNQVTSAVKRTNRAASQSGHLFQGILSKVSSIASAIFGIMGARAAITTSDTITSAENKLNYMNDGNKTLTQSQMDKMYASSQNSRIGYGDMMANVSKSMMLAPDAFGGNIDNAIRFQEIMGKSYTLAGASAAEMSSSMYQLIQGLGSGILQGDELRSVREGAPLAYKAIEEFAQGIFGAEENLKDLASEGKITSDIVVAAMLNMGDEVDAAFEDTAMTFGQAWTKIKNSATKAFEPVLQRLNELLNDFADSGGFEKIEDAFYSIANAANNVLTVLQNVYYWIVDNWSWLGSILEGVFLTLITLVIAYGIYSVASAVASAVAWAIAHWQLVLIIGVLVTILVLIFKVANGSMDACTAIGIALIVLGVIAGIMIGGVAGLIVGLILAVIGLFFMFMDVIVGVNWVCSAFFVNLGLWFANLGLAAWAVIKNIGFWFANMFLGVVEVVKVVANNIGVAFSNGWINVQTSFLSMVDVIMSGLKSIAQFANEVLGWMGVNIDTSGFDFAKSKISELNSKKGSYESVSDAWAEASKTFKYANIGDAFNTYDAFEKGWVGKAYNEGAAIGSAAQKYINDWASDKLGGLFGGITGSTLVASGALAGLNATGLSPDLSGLANDAGKTAGNTGKMADSMKLAEEDLKYLKDLAEQEWKKEFTTASITVDMSNYNNISGDSDLDGIVTKLTDKLYEELSAVADGIYAY